MHGCWVVGLCVLSGESGWQFRGVDVEEKGVRTDSCGTPFMRGRNLLRLPLPVVRVKLRLPSISMMNRSDHALSGSYSSNWHVPAALIAVTDVIKESVWFIIVHCFFTVGSVTILQLSFVSFVGEELTVFGFVREECEKTLRTTGL